jgi:AraC-like DNA-binding protein
MPLDVELKPVEKLIFRSDVVAMGSFRCPATHPLFHDSGPCSHHTFVFPRTATVIRHEGGTPFTATPNCVTLYNQNQAYSRSRISSVDACDWYVVADDVLFAAAGPAAADRGRPFTETHVSMASSTYIRQRQLFDRVRSGTIEPFAVDEEVLRLLHCVLGSDQASGRGPRASDGGWAGPRHEVCVPRPVSGRLREKVEFARRLIAASPARSIPLRTLAAAAASSPFHLCRAFRQLTGMSMTAWRHSIRLRLSLDLVHDRRDLSEVAMELGYASHSHFTAAFRRHFGVTPSQFRAGSMRRK